MKKICINCSKEYNEDENVFFCPDDGGYIIPENLKKDISKVVSVKDWIINLLILSIPVVGLIFAVIWANDDKNILRKNWASAMLIYMGILFLFSIFMSAVLFSIFIKL
jgi:predicted nucleic acid-binding Zn ribbon protein